MSRARLTRIVQELTALQHQGYGDAARVDAILNECVAKKPPEEYENATYYRTLLRTIQTSLDIIERSAFPQEKRRRGDL